jgi:hypothetical protein
MLPRIMAAGMLKAIDRAGKQLGYAPVLQGQGAALLLVPPMVPRCFCRGVPGEIRTHDPRIRNPVLYPAELRGRPNKYSSSVTYRCGS